MIGALDGIRVLDLGLLVQGPQAASMLGDLGAEVIKVELPAIGDQARHIPLSLTDRRAPFFVATNRGKRSLTIDLRRAAGAAVFRRLADTADVVISNFKPGTLDGWGLGYDVLAATNPRLVYATGSAFGPVGPDAAREGADLAAQAAGGLISGTGEDGGPPSPVAVTIADHIASQNMVAGVLAALFSRERTGAGQRVDVSLIGGQIYAQASEYSAHLMNGEPNRRADRGHPLIPMLYGIFPTADHWIALVGVPSHLRAAFFAAIDRPDLADDPRLARVLLDPESKRSVFAELDAVFRHRTSADWLTRLRAAGQRVAPVRDYAAVVADESVYENGYLVRTDDADAVSPVVVGSPVRLSATPTTPGVRVPGLGEHTVEVLSELGYADEDIAALLADGTC